MRSCMQPLWLFGGGKGAAMAAECKQLCVVAKWPLASGYVSSPCFRPGLDSAF